MKRLLIRDAALGHTSIEGSRLHYVTHVLRLGIGAKIEIFDGLGKTFDGVIESVDSDRCQIRLTNERNESLGRAIEVIQGLPKGDKIDLILQKGTELGVRRFLPVTCERSVVQISGKEESRRQRWQRIVEEAARQCGRSDLPQIALPGTLESAIGDLPPHRQILVLDEEERSLSLSEGIACAPDKSCPVILVVGPEGGLSRKEVAMLKNAGALSVTLGRLILRTETAALAAVTVLRHLEGRLG